MLIDNARINDVTRRILGAAIEVHRVLGPGLLESIYLQCLLIELTSQGLRFVVQQSVPIQYKGISVDAFYRIDLIVEDLVVVEIKCVDALSPIHQAQILTYLRLTTLPAGLLINFNAARLMDGVKRIVNTRPSTARRMDNVSHNPASHRGDVESHRPRESTGRPAQPDGCAGDSGR